MKMNEYIKEALKTESLDTDVILERFGKCIRLSHATDGICTEAGELKDIFKKYIYYGKEIDYVNLEEEIGDLLWYIAIICDAIEVSFERVADLNIKKLRKRYKNGFTENNAINRDTENELSHFDVTNDCEATIPPTSLK